MMDGWRAFWLGVRRAIPGGDWIIFGRYAQRVGDIPGIEYAKIHNDNRRKIGE